MERNSLNEALKRRASQLESSKEGQETALDDARRVKVLSPTRLVVKRFFRNRLAMIGLIILVVIFMFAFIGPFFYSYGETQVFMHYKKMPRPFATGTFNNTLVAKDVPDAAEEINKTVKNKSNSRALAMVAADSNYCVISDEKNPEYSRYILTKVNDGVFYWSALTDAKDGSYTPSSLISDRIGKLDTGDVITTPDGEEVDAALLKAARAEFAKLKGSTTKAEFEFNGLQYKIEKNNPMDFSLTMLSGNLKLNGQEVTADLVAAADAAVANDVFAWEADGKVYAMKLVEKDVYDIEIVKQTSPIVVLSGYTFHMTDVSQKLDSEVEIAALLNSTTGETFSVDGVDYFVNPLTGELCTADGTVIAIISSVKVVDSTAQDTFDIAFKDNLCEVMIDMASKNEKARTFVWSLKQMKVVTDKDGKENVVEKLNKAGEPVYADETLSVEEQNGFYTVKRDMPFYVTDKFAEMSMDHPFGTDGNGMDILARMMYGGRISLMVGFVVVILSMLIGVVLGGIAGYFGGWVDTLIMRLVEIFYCIPSYPILIILGGFMDADRMPPKERLYVMMAVLGLLGWAGIARLVRGQILSLREQEFMVASESTGIKVRHRIFRHLIPNVMPQLIVSATGSLGGVILTESSLSFLGLGVKFPLATWGNMIEFVTGLNENLGRYIYIWLPVGILICLTVISFNFVGDGLRDAFDPKMKR